MFSFEEHHYHTAEDFIAALRPTNWITSNSWSTAWSFRGHGNAEWKLRPSIWRLEQGIEPKTDSERTVYETNQLFRTRIEGIINGAINAQIIKRPDEKLDEYRQNLFEVLLRAHTEYLQIKEFLGFLDELGIATPSWPVSKLTTTKFVNSYADSIFEHNNNEIWESEAVALAQHHGIPTRLLDWTRNPLVAAYFAAESANPLAIDEKLAVFAMPTMFLKDRRLIQFQVPRHLNSYLHAQAGFFTIDSQGDQYYASYGRWLHLEESLPGAQNLYKPFPRKMTLLATEADRLLRLLWLENITRAHLMPTIDNAVIALKRKWKSISDMSRGND